MRPYDEWLLAWEDRLWLVIASALTSLSALALLVTYGIIAGLVFAVPATYFIFLVTAKLLDIFMRGPKVRAFDRAHAEALTRDRLSSREPRADRTWTCPDCDATLIAPTIASMPDVITEHLAANHLDIRPTNHEETHPHD